MFTLKRKSVLLSLLMVVILMSCNYSFSGASISPDIKTISIKNFPNYSSLGPPTLSQSFTEALKDLFIRQTSLSLVTRNGDLQFEGQISNYVAAPIAIQANDQAADNRLTITIDVKFVNTQDATQNFESSFSRFADYSANENLSAKEDELIREINEQLVQDIFNRSVSNW